MRENAITVVEGGELVEPLVVRNPTRVDLGGGSSEIAYRPAPPGDPAHDGEAWEAAVVFGKVRALKGGEHLQARQVVGATPYEAVIDGPLPDGLSLRSDSQLYWDTWPGPRTLELTEPPRIGPAGRTYTVLCNEREPVAA